MRSIAHLKMLQSLAGKLNRLNDVREIGEVIADELRLLIDYHNCRVSVIEGDEVVPIAFRGELLSRRRRARRLPAHAHRRGHHRPRRRDRRSRCSSSNTLECEFAVMIPGTHMIEESQIAVPLCYGARVIGVIVISKLGVDQFDEDDVRLLEVLAGHASVALENARLYEAQRREADHLKALLEFTGAISEAATPRRDRRARRCARPRGCSAARGARSGSRTRTATSGSARTRTTTPSPSCGAMLDVALAGDALREAIGDRTEPFLVRRRRGRRAALASRDGLDLARPRARAAAQRRRARGLHLRPRARPPTASTRSTRSCACSAASPTRRRSRWSAPAATRASRRPSSRPSRRSRTRSRPTTSTPRRTRAGSPTWRCASARRWASSAAELKRLELGALFHDIGKIGVPTSILLKPGPLSPEERAIIEMHPELGERILEPIERLAEVRTIVRSCHERWDGAGYPDGKAGEEIPLEARIIFVCDAFHAMTTDRPYRKRLSGEEACRRLREGAGTQFDPSVVDVFLGLPLEVPVAHGHRRRAAGLVASLERGKKPRARDVRWSRVRCGSRDLLVLVCVLGAAPDRSPARRARSQLSRATPRNIKLAVNAKGTALVTYSVRGKVTHLLAWGAVNARQRPSSPRIKQVEFKLDYSGGWKHHRLTWKTLQEHVRRLRRPRSPVARDRLQGAERLVLGAAELADGAARTSASRRGSASRRPGGCTSPTGPATSRSSTSTRTGSTAAASRRSSGSTRTRARASAASARRAWARRPTATAGCSSSTRTTRPTGRAGCARTPSSRTGRPGCSATASTPRNPWVGGYAHPRSTPNRKRGPGTGEQYRITAPRAGVTPDVMWQGPGLHAYDRHNPADVSLESR